MDFGLASLPILALSLLLGYSVFSDVSGMVFHEFHVPEELSKRGYAPQVVADRLGYKVLGIQRRVRAASDLPLVAAPAEDLSIDTLGEYFDIIRPVRAAQGILNLNSYDFSGDIVERGDTLLLSVVGVDHVHKRAFSKSMEGKDPEVLLGAMALEVVRFVNPLVAATYFYEVAAAGGFKDLAEAERAARHCVTTTAKADLPYAFNLHGKILFHQGKTDQALERFNQALALKPGFPLPLFNRAIAFFELKRYEEAETGFRAVLTLRGGRASLPAEAYTYLGRALLAQGRPAEAEEAYRKAIAADPDLADAFFHFSKFLREKGRTDEARDMLREAIDRAPGRAEFLAERARMES